MNSVQIDRTLTIKYSVDMTDGVAAEIDPLALIAWGFADWLGGCFGYAAMVRGMVALMRSKARR